MTFYRSYKIIIEKRAQRFLESLTELQFKKIVSKIANLTSAT